MAKIIAQWSFISICRGHISSWWLVTVYLYWIDWLPHLFTLKWSSDLISKAKPFLCQRVCHCCFHLCHDSIASSSYAILSMHRCLLLCLLLIRHIYCYCTYYSNASKAARSPRRPMLRWRWYLMDEWWCDDEWWIMMQDTMNKSYLTNTLSASFLLCYSLLLLLYQDQEERQRINNVRNQ